MSKLKVALLGTVLGAAAAATPAEAINIVLRPDATFTGSQGQAALFAFQKAANYWNQTLVGSTQTINIGVSFANLGDPNIIGQAGSARVDILTADVYDALEANRSGALDNLAVASLTPLTAAGGVGYRRPIARTGNPLTGLGLNTATTQFDNNDSYNNLVMYANTANLKGLGFTFSDNNSFRDANITFNSTFAFDFDPTDGITNNTQDFTAVALHEIGHALGFVSGTDFYDVYGAPNGPGANVGIRWDDESVLSVLDLYRYATSLTDTGGGVFDRQLQLAPNRNAFFSIDGNSPFIVPNPAGPQANETPFFSTGRYNGDLNQASHWKDAAGYFDGPNNICFIGNRQIGIMDPTSGSCQMGIVTANDLAAFDAIGYNLNFNLLAQQNYTFNTGQVFQLAGLASVPEPATWAMMIGGFGLLGGAMRRKKANVTVRFA